jgi:hypothetical protein
MPKGFPKGRTAFLVIHGIGEQNPYETLDSFGRGMHDHLRSLDPSITVEHGMASRQDPGGASWTEHFVRLRPAAGDDFIDVHEFYWAYLSEEKITVSEIWVWVEQTLKGTKKFYAENKKLAERYEGKYRFQRVAWMLRLMSMLYPLLLVFKAFSYLLPIDKIPWVQAVGQAIKRKTAYLLVGYIGDIAIYTTLDQKSRFFPIRQSILNKCQSLVEELLKGGYDRVIIAGHSLGSVIAYDTLNRINLKANMDAGKDLNLEKLSSLITFGSPLDKIAFFFREHAGKQQELRRQVLEHLHSFKTRAFDLEQVHLPLENPLQPRLAHVKWINYYNILDPVSGHLDYYDVNANVAMILPGPWGVAHVQYWDDREFFYRDIAERLLHEQG